MDSNVFNQVDLVTAWQTFSMCLFFLLSGVFNQVRGYVLPFVFTTSLISQPLYIFLELVNTCMLLVGHDIVYQERFGHNFDHFLGK